MKLTTGILILGMGLGTAWAQNPNIIDNTKNKLNAVQQQKTVDSNAALSTTAAPGKLVSASQTQAASQAAASKPQAAVASPPAASKTSGKTKAKAKSKTKTAAVAADQPESSKAAVAVEDNKPVDPKKDAHKSISVAGGRRDPFLSPVVNRSMGGSGCSTGKRCLAVDQIALTGIVKSDAGMIAVVINAMNKAYFLRENDPVFNGYVVKITGDSIVFKETMQDKLGKSFTREVTKKISTPAV